MPYEISLDGLPTGYASENAEGGEVLPVVVREFTSSQDGAVFVSRLEGWPTAVLAKLPAKSGVLASQIDHMLALVRRDKSTTVYINEIPIAIECRSKRAIEAGAVVHEDDIVDIRRLRLGEIEIPADVGVIFVFSHGWRKGLFYDFVPLGGDSIRRDYDLELALGSHYAYLSQQSLFGLDESAWTKLIEQQWFLFVTLKKASLRLMIQKIAMEKPVDDLISQINREVEGVVDLMLERWESVPVIREHVALLSHAIDKYKEGDHVSATAILYPRIEGIMRSLYESEGVGGKATQGELASEAVAARGHDLHERSWLMPRMFERFLKDAYFAAFEPGEESKLSRNSVGHGVAKAEDFNLKAVLVGLLTVDQIFFFLPKDTEPDNSS